MERRFYFQWHLTESCNLRCAHCYQNSDAHQAVVSRGDFELALGRIRTALAKWRLPGRVAITGGEPLVAANLHELLGLLDAEPWLDFFDVLSNGTLIDTEAARTLRGYQRLRRVQVSLDGADEQTHDAVRGRNTYRKAIDGLETLRKGDVKTSIMFTLFRRNRHQIRDILELAHAQGCESISIERLVPIGRGGELDGEALSATELEDAYRHIWEISKEFHEKGRSLRILKFRTLWAALDPEHAKTQRDMTGTLQLGASCSIGLDALTIMPDLGVLPCRRLPIPIGNLRDETLFKIWYGSDLLWKIRNKENLEGRCHHCELVALCGGCRAVAFAVTGNPLAEDPQCFLRGSTPA